MSPARTAEPEYESKHGRGNLADVDDHAGRSADSPEPPVGFEDEERRRPHGWTGGADFGLLLLRLGLGATFIAHGSQKLFGVLGGPGPDAFAKYLYALGFHHIQALTWVTGGTEIVGGGLLILGLFTPLAAAGLLGVIGYAVAIKVHPNLHDFGWMSAGAKSFEYEATLAIALIGVLFAGPGRAALDFGVGRAWHRRPLLFGFLCLLISAGAAAGIYFLAR